MKRKGDIDQIDSKIICVLQKDGRMPNTEIAKKLNIAESTVRNRLKRLLNEKIIQVVAVGDPHKLGFGIAGTMKIAIDMKKSAETISQLKKIDQIWYIALATGGTDLDIEFNVNSLEEFKNLVILQVNQIDGVIKTESSVIVEYIKRRYDWGTGQNHPNP